VLITLNRLLKKVLNRLEFVDIGKPHKPVSADLGAASIANLDKLRQSNGPEPTARIRLDMQKVMQTYSPRAMELTIVTSLFSVLKNHCKKESRKSAKSINVSQTLVSKIAV
jgi:succinate dehydrogenase/fumarate reductase flavoprotein subunit